MQWKHYHLFPDSSQFSLPGSFADVAKMSVTSGFSPVIDKSVNILFNSKDYLQTAFTRVAVVLLLGILYPHWGEELVRLSPRQSQLDTARAHQCRVVMTHMVKWPQRGGWLGLGTLHRKHLGWTWYENCLLVVYTLLPSQLSFQIMRKRACKSC